MRQKKFGNVGKLLKQLQIWYISKSKVLSISKYQTVKGLGESLPVAHETSAFVEVVPPSPHESLQVCIQDGKLPIEEEELRSSPGTACINSHPTWCSLHSGAQLEEHIWDVYSTTCMNSSMHSCRREAQTGMSLFLDLEAEFMVWTSIRCWCRVNLNLTTRLIIMPLLSYNGEWLGGVEEWYLSCKQMFKCEMLLHKGLRSEADNNGGEVLVLMGRAWVELAKGNRDHRGRRQKEILTNPRYTHKSPDTTTLLPVFYRAALRWRNSVTGQFLHRKIWSLSPLLPPAPHITPVFCLSHLISFCHPCARLFFHHPPLFLSSPFLLVRCIPPIMFHSSISIHLHVALLIPSHLLPSAFIPAGSPSCSWCKAGYRYEHKGGAMPPLTVMAPKNPELTEEKEKHKYKHLTKEITINNRIQKYEIKDKKTYRWMDWQMDK